MLTRPTAPAEAPPLRRLGLLVALFEEGLRCEAYHLAQRDTMALEDLLSRQGEILAEIVRIAAEHPPGAPLLRRLQDLGTARKETFRAADQLKSELSAELSSLSQSAARLRQVRRTSASIVSSVPPPLRGWA